VFEPFDEPRANRGRRPPCLDENKRRKIIDRWDCRSAEANLPKPSPLDATSVDCSPP
jgi:hypothetical protein